MKKRQVPALKLVRETVRDLSGAEMSRVAGGANPIGQSQLPTCLCSSIPCGGLPSIQADSCIAVSGAIC